MAQLFKNNIIKEKLENFEIPELKEKIKILKNWYKLNQNNQLKNKKEEELEGPFGNEIFGKVLGYESLTQNSTYSRKFQPKVPVGGQKADIGLGFFDEKNDIMKVVVELKDAKTSLDKPQQRTGNLTPVQQAFKYKPYFKECDFIIVSNFIEIRLYIDSYYDYEVWTLDDLVNSKDNDYNFRKFYYLLCKDNLITKKGDSNTKSLLSFTRIQEKEITKKFYKEYSLLRKELFKDIVSHNSFKKKELDFVLNKTQKIIDRIIFIHFCEDLNLLPNGKLNEVVEYGERSLSTTWETLQNFFRAVDQGSEKLGIPDGYNGGLFSEDKGLNNLKVGDKICKKFVKLGDYDFADDLSVNILGHIFEQSISDIEEIKEKINKDEDINTISKRKKDGIFYTPEYIVDYIVTNSVGKKIDDLEEELKQKHKLKENILDKNYTKRAIAVYEELQEKVQNIKVLDPACGSGAFLVKVFDFLLDKNKEIANKLEDLTGVVSMQNEGYFKNILQNNIYGVDLNDESIEISKLSLWLKTAQKGKKLANLDSNIKCGNSLIDDKEIAGDKAFVWENEFKEIFDNGGFDVVVGNPPYVPAEGIKENEKIFLENKFDSAKGRINLYIIFYELGIKLLKENGRLGFITPYTLLKNKYYRYLREYILKNSIINTLVDFQNFKIFEDAVVDSIILILEKKKINNYIFNYISNIDSFQGGKYIFNEVQIKNILNSDDLSFIINNSIKLDDILKNTIKISEIVNFKQGIITGGNKKYLTKNKSYLTKPILTGRNFNRYLLNYDGDLIIYDKNNLHRPRVPSIFEVKEKILLRQTGSYPITTIDTKGHYTLDTVHNGLIINNNFSSKYLMCLLNSLLLKYIYKININEDGKVFAQVKIIYINELPIKNIPPSKQKPFIQKADFMLEKNKELQEKLNSTIEFLKQKFRIEKVGKKLGKFYELEFFKFYSELKKSCRRIGGTIVQEDGMYSMSRKLILTLNEEEELMSWFNGKKDELVVLKNEIDSCDREIDDMIFDLYGLDEGERKVVLGS